MYVQYLMYIEFKKKIDSICMSVISYYGFK